MTLAAVILLAALKISVADEIPCPDAAGMGLSGLAWRGGSEYYAVDDRNGNLLPMTISTDGRTGRIRKVSLGRAVRLAGRRDLEEVALDPADGALAWVCDEHDNSIRAFDPSSGAEKARVAVPAVYRKARPNFGFESLAIDAVGKELWTCNEEALACDGPRSSRRHGSPIRIQRFTRAAAGAPWLPSGQWLYVTDPIGGSDFAGKARSGVSDLCVLPDGRLLALEREFSMKTLIPSFRCRIYEVDVSAATDVTKVKSLLADDDRDVSPASKRLVFDRNTAFTMYETLCLGPELEDGSRLFVMVADSGEYSASKIMTLKVEF